jgi:hypothetical protein
MAVASLSKFTVPTGLPSDSTSNTTGLLMPKLKYRFRATFTSFGAQSGTTPSVTELTRQVQDIKRPNVNFNPVTIDVYNSKVFLMGKPEWQETTVTLRDDVTGAVSKLVGQQIQKQFDFMEQASAPSGINYKFRLTFDMLDGGNGNIAPVVLESWDLEGCFLSQVDYGDMAYNSSDPALITLNVKFDNATQTYGTAGSNWVTPTPGESVN